MYGERTDRGFLKLSYSIFFPKKEYVAPSTSGNRCFSCVKSVGSDAMLYPRIRFIKMFFSFIKKTFKFNIKNMIKSIGLYGRGNVNVSDNERYRRMS